MLDLAPVLLLELSPTLLKHADYGAETRPIKSDEEQACVIRGIAPQRLSPAAAAAAAAAAELAIIGNDNQT